MKLHKKPYLKVTELVQHTAYFHLFLIRAQMDAKTAICSKQVCHYLENVAKRTYSHLSNKRGAHAYQF